MEYKINTTLPIQFEKIENPPYLKDSRFQTYKAWIAHDLENYNGSYFDVEILKKMGGRLAGVPVVGYIAVNNVNDKDFQGHEERLVIQDGDINIEYLGRAYGCVLENNDWKIEQKQHEDGSMRNYLTCNCILWNMFSDAVEIFNRDEKKSQSMELQEGSIQGKFEKDGYFHFTDATIRALCILGEGVSPAMSNSVIEKFSHTNFSNQVQELLSEINESIKKFSQQNQSSTPDVDNIKFNQEGGTNIVGEKIKLLEKYGLTLETVTFSVEDMSIEELEIKLKEEFEKEPEVKVVSEFSATYRQKREALQNALDPKIEKDADGNITYEEYLWVNDFDEKYVYVEKTIWTPDYENKYGRFTYTFDETTLTATVTSEFEEMVLVWLTLDENQKLQEERANSTVNYEKLQGEFEEYKKNYSTPNNEVERLKEFEINKLSEERKSAEKAIFTEFEDLNGIEEFETLKTKASECELEILTEKCFAIRGKKNSNFSLNKNRNSTIKIKVEHKETDDEPYGGLISKYKNK